MNFAPIPLICSFYLLNIVNTVNSYESLCGDFSECKRIIDCGKQVEHIKKLHLTNSIHHRNLLLGPIQRITCGFDGRIPKICCPIEDVYTKFGESRIKTNLRNRSIPGNCGNFLWNKNLPPDGGATDLFEFPWLALLQYQKSSGDKKFGCGGVLISDRYVLTAAHCLRPSLKLLSVRLGEYDLKTGRDCFLDDPKMSSNYCNDNSIEVGIEEEIIHQGYKNLRGPSDFNPQTNDIALLRLSQSVQFSDFVKPICLPGSEAIKGGKYLVAGWGAVTDTDYPKSDLKRMFRLNLTEKNSCDRIYGRTLQQDVMCATAKVNNVGCIGDSGGPLMAVDKQSRMTVIGIYAPAGTGYCWTTSIPNTYTDVRLYRDWIIANMEP